MGTHQSRGYFRAESAHKHVTPESSPESGSGGEGPSNGLGCLYTHTVPTEPQRRQCLLLLYVPHCLCHWRERGREREREKEREREREREREGERGVKRYSKSVIFHSPSSADSSFRSWPEMATSLSSGSGSTELSAGTDISTNSAMAALHTRAFRLQTVPPTESRMRILSHSRGIFPPDSQS